MAIPAIGTQACGGQSQHGAQTLAARGDEMIGHFGNHRHIRAGQLQNGFVHPLHIGMHQSHQRRNIVACPGGILS